MMVKKMKEEENFFKPLWIRIILGLGCGLIFRDGKE